MVQIAFNKISFSCPNIMVSSLKNSFTNGNIVCSNKLPDKSKPPNANSTQIVVGVPIQTIIRKDVCDVVIGKDVVIKVFRASVKVWKGLWT